MNPRLYPLSQETFDREIQLKLHKLSIMPE
jgi:hypothetical protein